MCILGDYTVKEYKYNTVSELLDEIAEKINSKEILTQDWIEEIIRVKKCLEIQDTV